MKEYRKQYYDDNKQELVAKATTAKKLNQTVLRDYYIAAKHNKPCADCSKAYPYWIMQFDHRPGEIKRYAMPRIISNSLPIEVLKAEIAKCDIVCANCHAGRTHERQFPSKKA